MTNDEPSPSMLARDLHSVSDDDARAFVDALFGGGSEWRSLLIQYRLESDFQADWKAEVGNWIKTAERLGFLAPLITRTLKRAKHPTDAVAKDLDPNDRHHNMLFQELAPSMAIHYLLGTGWTFDAWEPTTGGQVDVDFSAFAPNGQRVCVQVKAPDRPGRIVDGRIVDGERDEDVVHRLSKAAEQLPRGTTEPNLIIVSAHRNAPLAYHCECLVTDLIGSTIGNGTVVSIRRQDRGRFFTDDWKHISAVVMLDYLRGVDDFKYTCTVLTNPQATNPISADAFPHARVAVLRDGRFRWQRGEPGDDHTLPDGTVLAGDAK